MSQEVRDYPLDEIILPMGGTSVKDETKMEEIWESGEYIAEEKYDGSRYLSIGGRFFSRRVSVVDHLPVEKTDNVPHLNEALHLFPNLILDGEVYLVGETSNEVTSIMGSIGDKAWRRQGFGQYLKSENGEETEMSWRRDGSQEWQKLTKKDVEDFSLEKKPLQYVVFDILRDIDGKWLTDLTWIERRKKLEEVIAVLNNACTEAGGDNIDFIHLSDYRIDNKKEFCAEIMARGGEGVMLKNINGKYTPGKKPRWNWVKVKQEITADVIITGFKPAVKEYTGKEIETWEYWFDEANQGLVRASDLIQGRDSGEWDDSDMKDMTDAEIYQMLYDNCEPVTKYHYMGWIGSIEFSQYNSDGELVPMGECSGITEELRKDMSENPDKYLGQVMEISAMQVTKDGFFRHPQFLKLRNDKSPEDCIVGVL